MVIISGLPAHNKHRAQIPVFCTESYKTSQKKNFKFPYQKKIIISELSVIGSVAEPVLLLLVVTPGFFYISPNLAPTLNL